MKIVQLQTPKQGIDAEVLAQACHDEYATSHEFDTSAVAESCWRCVADKERKYLNCWLAYDDDDIPVGALIGAMYRSVYSRRFYAIQEMWFVVPRARRSLAAIQLLLAYEKWATARNAERIYTQVEHDNEPKLVERIIKFMQGLGYNKQGYIAVKRPKYTQEEPNNDRSTHRGVGAEQAQV